MRTTSALNSPWLCLLIALIGYGAVTAGRLADYAWDPSAFVVAGDQFVELQSLPSPIRVGKQASGYDGQFYYGLALDPFASGRVRSGVTLDTPGYRSQRILYPTLVWLLAAGQPALVAPIMFLTNLLLLGGIAWFGGWFAQAVGRHALWGLIPASYAGFHFTLFRDLTEITECALLIAGLTLIRRERQEWAAAVLSLAVLARETAVLVAAGLAAVWLWQRLRRCGDLRWFVFVVPIITFSAWQLLLRWLWGDWASKGGQGNLGMPLAAIGRLFTTTSALDTHLHRVWFSELCVITVVALLTLAALRRSGTEPWIKVSWVLFLLLASLLTQSVWVEDWAFMRAIAELHLMAALIAIGSPLWLRAPVAFLYAGLWIYTAHGMVTGR